MAYKGNIHPLGIVLILLLLQSGGIGSGSRMGGSLLGGSMGGLGILSALTEASRDLPLQNFSKDMHRMVSAMDRLESLGQLKDLAQLSQISQLTSSAPTASLPASASSSAAPSLAAGIDALGLPDMDQLLELAGPLLSLLNRQD